MVLPTGREVAEPVSPWSRNMPSGNTIAYGAAGIGVIFLWSAIFNKHITSTIQDLVTGQKPTPGPSQNLSLPSSASSSAGGGGGGGVAPSGPGETAYFTAMLATLGAPPTKANLDSLGAWYHHENSGWPPGCQNNALNTTLGVGGDCNSVGVKTFSSEAYGVAENAKTLLGGYPQIVSALRSGKGVCGGAFSGEFSKWSGSGYSEVC